MADKREKRKKKTGKVWMSIGLLMILAALFLTCYNIWSEKQAERASNMILEQLDPSADDLSEDDDSGEQIPRYMIDPDMEMPTILIDGYRYIGVLEIPVLGLELPVMDSWSYPKLRISPCRYQGSAYSNDMIIAGHNYNSHFGRLKTLSPGDQVIFTDVEGHQFLYCVEETDILGKTAVEEMEAGDWDLTLFTCTYGGQSRVTVRCKKDCN